MASLSLWMTAAAALRRMEAGGSDHELSGPATTPEQGLPETGFQPEIESGRATALPL